jgi:hypothetical protein
VVEVESVRLEDLPVVHEPPHLIGRRRHGVYTDNEVGGFGGGQMVAHGADAAQPLHNDRHFPVEPALREPFEPPELDDVEPGLFDLIVLVEMDRHLPVTFYAGHGVDDDLSFPFSTSRGHRVASSFLRVLFSRI